MPVARKLPHQASKYSEKIKDKKNPKHTFPELMKEVPK